MIINTKKRQKTIGIKLKGDRVEKVILHCDLNNFYASVEIQKRPELKGKCIAVCGKTEDRHGIVLAKSEPAKALGVSTGDVIWQAKKKCPDLIVVPPRFNDYQKFSSLVREIYYRYTDLVEPFGLDECWLDVTKSVRIFGSGEEIAFQIKEAIKSELGLTISVGVSFNKVFAKLGSDMKKPDAITVISPENFKEKIYHLNANELIGIGRASYKKLVDYNIKTIGDLATCDVKFLTKIIGKNGYDLHEYANGRDFSRVSEFTHSNAPKSVSNGITCTNDLVDNDEVKKVILKLSQDVGKRLRKYGYFASVVQISIKDNKLKTREFQAHLKVPTKSFIEISELAFELFLENYKWENLVRAVSISASKLNSDKGFVQLDMVETDKKSEKKLSIEQAMDKIREKYGKDSIEVASLTGDIKIAKDKTEVKVLPGSMNKN